GLLDLAQVGDRHEPNEPALRDDRDRLKVVRQNDVADQLPDRGRRRHGSEIRGHELTHPNATDSGGNAVLSNCRAREAEQKIGEDEEPRAPGVALEEHRVRPDQRQDARDDLSAARGDARRQRPVAAQSPNHRSEYTPTIERETGHEIEEGYR